MKELLFMSLVFFFLVGKTLASNKELHVSKASAILINGWTGKAFANDIKFVNQTLLGLGFKEDHILNVKMDFHRSGKGSYIRRKMDIYRAFKKLAKTHDPSGAFFIYVTSHGYNIEGDTQMLLADNVLWGMMGKDFDDLLKKFFPPSMKVIMVVDTCHSGAMHSTFLGSPYRLLITSSGSDNLSYIENFGHKRYGSFTYYFFSAIQQKFPSQEVVESDANTDGYVGFQEAYIWAKENDLEKPRGILAVLMDYYLVSGVWDEGKKTPQFYCSNELLEEGDQDFCQSYFTGL